MHSVFLVRARLGMNHPIRLLAAIAFLTACADSPTDSTTAPHAAVPVGRTSDLGGVEILRGESTASQYSCFLSKRNYGGVPKYRYVTIKLRFPSSMISPLANRQLTYRSYAGIRGSERGVENAVENAIDGRRVEVDRVAECILPGGDAAIIALGKLLRVKLPASFSVADETRLSSVGGPVPFVSIPASVYELQTVLVEGCEYGGSYPWCNPPPMGGGSSGGGGGTGNPFESGGGSGASGGAGATPTPPPPNAEDSEGPLDPPNCADTNLLAMAQAWCSGREPTADELEKINAALERMKAKGGVCQVLADIGYSYIGGNLRMFDDQRVWTDAYGTFAAGAVAPRGGRRTAYIGIGWNFTARFYDAQHQTVGQDEPRTLQQVLAHELDHLNGADHLKKADGSVNAYRTPNSQACSDLQ